MWIFLPNSVISVVAHREAKGYLLVRARKREDLDAFLAPIAGGLGDEVVEIPPPDADYRFRVALMADQFFAALRAHQPTYPNFKDSVDPADPERRRYYHDVYALGVCYQAGWDEEEPL